MLVIHVQLHFYGDDTEVNLETEDKEFKTWTWMPMQELVPNVVPFKRLVYEQVGTWTGECVGVCKYKVSFLRLSAWVWVFSQVRLHVYVFMHA